jgi:hypothetical protein
LSSKSDLDVLEFLRKAAIFEFCLFNSTLNGVDWDAVLSPPELFKRYAIEAPKSLGDLESLTPFTFCDLPEKYLSFARPPYNVDLTVPYQLFLSLLTGEILSVSDYKVETYEKFDVWLERVMMRTFCPLLVLRGESACRPVYRVFGRDSNPWIGRDPRYVNIRDFYVDDFGEADWGMHSGRMLSLSRDVLDAEIDRLLSHRWTDQCY